MARRKKLKLLRQNKKQARRLTGGSCFTVTSAKMPREEREALLEAKQQLEEKVYLGKVMRDLRIALEPVAIKSQLSPQGKQIFWNITAGGYQLTGVGLASQAAMLFSGR